MSVSRGRRGGAPTAGPIVGALLFLAAAGSELRAISPLSGAFEANQGQSDPRVRFLWRGGLLDLFLTDHEAVFRLRAGRALEASVVRMSFPRSNPRARPAPSGQLPGWVHSFAGRDSRKWRTGIPLFARVDYEDVYPGVSLSYYRRGPGLEWDFRLEPGADPERIRVRFGGAEGIRLAGDGSLLVQAASGTLRHLPPVAWQEVAGRRRGVAASFRLRGASEVGFDLGPYDPGLPLVIDPVLSYSTFLGGSSLETGNAIAADSAGSAYVAGETASVDFPVSSGATQVSLAGEIDAFVAKLDSTGSTFLWATYLGGGFTDRANAVAIDGDGNVYVAGETGSTDFPVTPGAFQPSSAGSSDAFVVKLDPTGSTRLYATYLGGSGQDRANGIAVDASGSAYLTGRIGSTDFPITPDAFQTFFRGEDFDAFVTRLDAAGSALLYSTYLGGEMNDAGFGIAVDSSGSAHVAGGTNSSDFPATATAYQGSGLSTDAFITQLNPAGTGLLYSTYLGGSFPMERANAIALDAAGMIYVTGQTPGTDFPTVSAAQPVFAGGGNDAFVAKLDPAASGEASLLYSTYLGGTGDDRGNGIALATGGEAIVFGQTSSADLALMDPIQSGYGGGLNDAFLARVAASGASLLLSTFLGGTGEDRGLAVAIGPGGDAFLTGTTASDNFPTVAPAQPLLGGSTDAFVARVAPAGPGPTPTPTAGPASPIPTLSPGALALFALFLAAAALRAVSRR